MLLALLADGDAAARRVCADHLRQWSYEIDETDDGRDALAKAIARNPSLIVTAAQLPGVSGIELCRLLRTDAVTTATLAPGDSAYVATGDVVDSYGNFNGTRSATVTWPSGQYQTGIRCPHQICREIHQGRTFSSQSRQTRAKRSGVKRTRPSRIAATAGAASSSIATHHCGMTSGSIRDLQR